MSTAFARNTDPSTSHEAAASLSSEVLTLRESLVISTLEAYGPMTQEEVADATGIERPAISPRFAPLVKKGFIQVIGQRKNRSGRKANVFALKILNA
jgi:DNA-binding MarR family transcriptional regulator